MKKTIKAPEVLNPSVGLKERNPTVAAHLAGITSLAIVLVLLILVGALTGTLNNLPHQSLRIIATGLTLTLWYRLSFLVFRRIYVHSPRASTYRKWQDHFTQRTTKLRTSSHDLLVCTSKYDRQIAAYEVIMGRHIIYSVRLSSWQVGEVTSFFEQHGRYPKVTFPKAFWKYSGGSYVPVLGPPLLLTEFQEIPGTH